MANTGRGRDLDRLRQQLDDEANKRLNLALRGREKLFGEEEEAIAAREARISSMQPTNPCGPGYEYITAPTSGKTDAMGRPRPRAYFACYSIDKEMEVLVIGMRDTIDKDNSMIMYDGVDPVLWDVLKNSDSTSGFINMYLEGVPWSRVKYSNLPRKRPDEFRFGSGQ
jgi:hypothetical protein